MQTVVDTAGVRAAVAEARAAGRRISLVPTMGNLHAGHLSLVRRARQLADFSVATVFVNPFQFGANEDFGSYPRTLQADSDMLEREQLDLLFLPQAGEVYPHGPERSTRIEVPDLSDKLCGLSRPTFFRGVATVVNILFNMVTPDVAVFGEKDYQQLMVIRRMVNDLCMPIAVESVPTMREADGLAMSSRNGYLNAEERSRAALLRRLLVEARDAIREGVEGIQGICSRSVEELERAGFRPDYFSVRRCQDLEPAADGDRELVILAAAWLGKARLIDNITV